MKAYLVTEGESDAQLLRVLLAKEVRQGLRILPGGGRSAAISLARSLNSARQAPVALVVDADTTNEGRVSEDRDSIGYLLRMHSSGAPIEVFLAVPEVEVLLFSDLALLTRVLGREITHDDWITGRFEPKKTLGRILGTNGRTGAVSRIAKNLSRADVAQLADHPLIRDIRHFLAEAMQPEMVQA